MLQQQFKASPMKQPSHSRCAAIDRISARIQWPGLCRRSGKFAAATCALVLALAFTVVADEPIAAVDHASLTRAMESFAGDWEIAKVQPSGAAKDAHRLVFHQDGTYAALGGDGKERWAGTFEIDPTAAPMIWDHRSYEAIKGNKDVLGIYELDGDRLKVACVVGEWKDRQWIGKPRPTGFTATQADVVMELKRAKSRK